MSDSDSDSGNVMDVAVEATRENPTKTTVRARDFELTIDEPEGMGGTDEGANPLEYLLAAQAGCLNVTGQQVAGDMGIEIEALDIDASGEFDLGAFETERPDEPTRVQNIEVEMRVEADADDETLREWGERVEARCPVSGNVKNETDVSLTVQSQ